jgi:rhodanese-related sulfurtransferase
MHKKTYSIFALLIIFSMILGACATPTSAPVQEPAPAAAQPAEPVQPAVPVKAVAPTAVPPTPEPTPEPVVEVDVEAMAAELIAALPADKGYGSVAAAKLNEELVEKPPFLVDLREAEEIEKDGYIEGAIHIPVRELLKNLDKLPGMDQPIVVYCGIGHRGGFALAALTSLGYTKVRSLTGGIALWKGAELPLVSGTIPEAKSISSPDIYDAAVFELWDEFLSTLPQGFLVVKADKAAELLSESNAPVMIDLRTDAEVEKDGYIDGSIHIPMQSLLENLDKLPAKDTPLVLYCGIGHRGAVVLPILKMLGYEKVSSLYGGLRFWKSALMPVAGWVDWKATWTGYFAALPENFYAIKADSLNTALVENPPFLLDVREASEVEQNGYIEGSVHIPFREVLKNLDKLTAQEKPIVVLCASGHRGAMVMSALQLLGYKDVKNLVGGLGAWKKAEFAVVMGVPEPAEAGEAPTVDPVLLRDMDAFITGLPEGFALVKPVDLNADLAGGSAPFLVDLRTEKEREGGYIEEAVWIPVHDLFTELGQLPADKTAPIVLICQSGHRGGFSLMALQMIGYTNVRNLGGGMNAWNAAELPVTK